MRRKSPERGSDRPKAAAGRPPRDEARSVRGPASAQPEPARAAPPKNGGADRLGARSPAAPRGEPRGSDSPLPRGRSAANRGKSASADVADVAEARREIALALAASTGLEDAVERVLECLCTSLGWGFGAVWTVDRAAELLRCAGTWHGGAEALAPFAEETRGMTFSPGVGTPGSVWATRTPAFVPDVTGVLDFPRAPLAEAVGLHGAFAFPIVLGDEVLGVVEFFDDVLREPDPDAVREFGTIGGQIGRFLEQHAEHAALARRGDDLADTFENAPIGMHWASADGTILRVNQAELDLLGFSREEYVGHHVAEFHADPLVAEDLLARLARGETLKEYEARLRAKDGSLRHVRISSNVLWSSGRFVHTRCFTRDVTERVLSEAALRESEERFRLMVDGVKDYAIHTLGPDGKITSWNSGAERLHGFTADEVLGADVASLYAPADRASRLPERLLREAAETGESHHEGWRLRKDGSRFWADSVLTALRDGEGRLRGFTRLARDVTDRMHVEALRRKSAETEAENRRLVEAWKLQAEFLGSMSRELKTPLGAALAAAERMHEGARASLTEEERSHLDDIGSGLRHVLRAFDEVFDVVRLESGRIHLRLQRVDLARLAQEAREVLRSHAAEKRVHVEIDFAPALPEIEADPALLKLVLHNLLWSAIRSAWPDGLVPLYIAPEGPEAFRVEIVDDGLDRPLDAPGGLGASDSPAGRGAEDLEDDASSGLAEMRLAVTRRIVEAHGGRVGSRDAPGGGRVHFVVLPRVARPAPAAGTPLPDSSGVAVATEEKTVLVIEGNAASRAWLTWTLSNAGWNVAAAKSGEDALALCRERAFQAIAVDLLLPDGLAAEVVRKIRSEGVNRTVPILLATVSGETEGVAGARVSDVLARPIRTDYLFFALERAGVERGLESRVLVLDSDASAREEALASLRVLGYGAVGVENSEEGLRAAAEALPTGVILGVDPASGGLEFLRHFRRMPQGGTVPVLLSAPAAHSQADVCGLCTVAQADVLTCPGGRPRILQEIEAAEASAGRPAGG